jgi:succinate dehydrogenase/fumarate reductase cytochrome b subunit
MKTLLVIGFLLVIVYNLGAGLYFMIVDKGGSDRMVKALTRRIALSVALFLLILVGIGTGFVQPHGVLG